MCQVWRLARRRRRRIFPRRACGMGVWQNLWQKKWTAPKRPKMDEDREPFRPPYMSFQTFWRFIEELHSKPLPPQIDRSLMVTKSGTDQASLSATLAAFGLIGPRGEVQPALTRLVQGEEESR